MNSAPLPGSATQQEPIVVSVVVNNYNYERFLPRAIESALAQSYSRVEVLVVDDGSTDGSREIITGFGERVAAVFKENGGQGSAFNEGLARSTGDIVIFLDSDDYLEPEAVAAVVESWSPGLAKVQYRLAVVDGEGKRIGEYPPPDVPLASGDVVPLLLRSGHYSTAVTSGNAYTRAALERVFPVPAAEFRYSADGYVNAAVPFHGEVYALERVLGAYRVHEGNFSDMGGRVDVARFHYVIAHQQATGGVIMREAAAQGLAVESAWIFRHRSHLEARLASLRLDPEDHPVPGDRRSRLALRGIRAVWGDTEMSTTRRIADSLWFVAVAVAPSAVARRAIAWKYVRSTRPVPVRVLVRRVKRLMG
jgi:glycosyltransferase involved in cell wall biosynthesis